MANNSTAYCQEAVTFEGHPTLCGTVLPGDRLLCPHWTSHIDERLPKCTHHRCIEVDNLRIAGPLGLRCPRHWVEPL